MLKVGLTGGIACGKTTISGMFDDLGVPVIDADIIARDLVTPGQPALAEIERQLGPGLMLPDGRLDRVRLKRLIFTDAEKKSRLEALLHPLVYQAIEQQMALLSAPYVIVSVPLLLETGGSDRVDRVLVVTCSDDDQYRRLLARDGIDYKLASAMIASQTSDSERKAAANDLIENNTGLDLLAVKVKKLHNFYLTLATSDSL